MWWLDRKETGGNVCVRGTSGENSAGYSLCKARNFLIQFIGWKSSFVACIRSDLRAKRSRLRDMLNVQHVVFHFVNLHSGWTKRQFCICNEFCSIRATFISYRCSFQFYILHISQICQLITPSSVFRSNQTRALVQFTVFTVFAQFYLMNSKLSVCSIF